MNRHWSYYALLLFFLLSFSVSFPQKTNSPGNMVDSLLAELKFLPDGPPRFKMLGAISWEYINRSNYQQAGQYADSIFLSASRLNDSSGKVYARFYYGVIARHEGRYREALEHLKQFIWFYKAAGDSSRVAAGLFQFAAINTTIGKYNEALAANYRIVSIHAQNKYHRGVAFTQNMIGVVHRKMKKFNDAIESYGAAIKIYDSISAPEDKADVIGNLANVYVDMGKFDEALQLYHLALHVDRSVNYEKGIAYDFENIGTLFEKRGNYDSALLYQLRALEIRKRNPGKFELATSLNKTGQAYSKNGNPGLAEKYLFESLPLVLQTGSLPLTRDVYQNIANLYADKKQFNKAYQYQQLYVKAQDSLLNQEVAQQMNLLHAAYETESKNQQITQLTQEKLRQESEAGQQAAQKKLLIAGGLLVLALGALVAYILYQRLRSQKALAAKNKEIDEANYRKKFAELELKALQAQINPHFIFNCINSINQLILREENLKASGYLIRFAKLIRLVLENAAGGEISLENELILLQEYVALEALRFKDGISINIEADDSIDLKNVYVPPMLLQPILENSIHHGLMLKEDKTGHIQIHLRKTGAGIVCSIEDNGIGREKSMALREKAVWKNRSMGLKISQERLTLMGNASPNDSIVVTDLKNVFGEPTGTKVEVELPINSL